MLRQNNFKKNAAGFTLIELMIVVAIIGILSAIAYPSLQDSINKGYISDGLSDLSAETFNMEQKYQENRTYRDPNDATKCAVADLTSDYFSFSCTSGSRTTFLWSATSLSGSLGAAGSYQYNIDQDGTKKTIAYKGSTVNYNNWAK